MMTKEDYIQYYIQGSDHYLIPKDIFNELYDEMNNWKQDTNKYKEVIDKVRNIAYEYGQIDGVHHKTWVIDQIIRELLGTEYDNFIKEYEEDGEYTWDIGIAP